ncbi:MAG: ribonuclease H-like domain-containing protein [Gammaproteobacteria bacterium]
MADFRSRLDGLRRQSGSLPEISGANGPAPTPERNTTPLRMRLQRMLTPRAVVTGRDARAGTPELAALVGGELVAEGVIATESVIPYGTRHGVVRLEGDITHGNALFGQDRADHDGDLVFMDTETTGLAGGTGTLVFLLGLARLAPDGLHMHQYLLTGFSGEPAMLAAAGRFLEDASTLVTFNGKGFDSPLLAARYRLAAMPDPFGPLQHLDLLHPTRRAFGSRWGNCRLQTAERQLLGYTRTDDLSGAEAPQVWFQWVRCGITQRLPALVEHNRRDVISLVALLHRLREAYDDPTRHDADALAVARHRAQHNGEDLHAQLLAYAAGLDTTGLLELARAHGRKGEWAQATHLWHRIAEQDHPEALQRLAMYYEHVTKDMQTALTFTHRLCRLRPSDGCHQHRRRRLEHKLGMQSTTQTRLEFPPAPAH